MAIETTMETAINWSTILQTFIAAGFGTFIFETVRERVNYRRDRNAKGAYLAIRLAVILEEFATDCASLIETNTRSRHRPDGGIEDYEQLKIELPPLPPLPSDDTDGWRAIQSPLFTKVLGFKNRIANAQAMMEYIAEEDDMVELGFARLAGSLGIDAYRTAQRLRSEFRAPPVELEWNYPDLLETTLAIAEHPTSHGLELELLDTYRDRVRKRLMRRLGIKGVSD